MLTKEEMIYFNLSRELKEQINKRKEELKETKYNLSTELDISIRVSHTIQEEYIRHKLEPILTELDFINELEMIFNKYKKEISE